MFVYSGCVSNSTSLTWDIEPERRNTSRCSPALLSHSSRHYGRVKSQRCLTSTLRNAPTAKEAGRSLYRILWRGPKSVRAALISDSLEKPSLLRCCGWYFFFVPLMNCCKLRPHEALRLTMRRTPGEQLEGFPDKHYGPGHPYYADFSACVRRGLEKAG